MISLVDLSQGSKVYENSNTVEFYGLSFQNSKIIFRGKNNRLVVKEGAKIINCSLAFFCDNAVVFLGERSKLTGDVKIGFECRVDVGRDVSVTGNLKLYVSEKTSVHLGDDCMIGSAVTIMTHDFHPIFDGESKKRVNKSKDIWIGSRVWLANETVVMKGAVIGCGAVVGMRSMVLGEIPGDCVAVGSPARVIKRNVIWDRRSLNTTAPYFFESPLEWQ